MQLCVDACAEIVDRALPGQWQCNAAAELFSKACPSGAGCKICSEIAMFFRASNQDTLRYTQSQECRELAAKVLQKFKAEARTCRGHGYGLFSSPYAFDETSDTLQCAWRSEVPKVHGSASNVLILTKMTNEPLISRLNRKAATRFSSSCTTRACECAKVRAFFLDASAIELKIDANSTSRTHIQKKLDTEALGRP